MSNQRVAALLIVATVVVWIITDILLATFLGNGATISQTFLHTCERYRGFAICVAFSIGVLFGHLFLPQHVSP